MKCRMMRHFTRVYTFLKCFVSDQKVDPSVQMEYSVLSVQLNELNSTMFSEWLQNMHPRGVGYYPIFLLYMPGPW